MTDNTNSFARFMSNVPIDPDNGFKLKLKDTFGDDLFNFLIKEGSDPYPKSEAFGIWAIDFADQNYPFTLVHNRPQNNWHLFILHENKPFITNIISPPPDSLPEEMALTFHALKAEMIVELEDHLKQKEFEAQLRAQRNADISGPDPALLLPNTMIRIADWECQLILAAVGSGLPASKSVSLAKEVIYIQTREDGGEPGDLSLVDKCKSKGSIVQE